MHDAAFDLRIVQLKFRYIFHSQLQQVRDREHPSVLQGLCQAAVSIAETCDGGLRLRTT